MLEINNTTLNTIENITPTGLLTYGPYLKNLKKGDYQITLKYSINNIAPGEPALKWDILINMQDVIARGEILKEEYDGIKSFIYRFSLNEGTNLLEFRTFLNNSNAKITLYLLEFKRIKNKNNKNAPSSRQ